MIIGQIAHIIREYANKCAKTNGLVNYQLDISIYYVKNSKTIETPLNKSEKTIPVGMLCFKTNAWNPSDASTVGSEAPWSFVIFLGFPRNRPKVR